ncbi:glycylpeptide N-tetradecanoyltransferase [Apiospora arundinis]
MDRKVRVKDATLCTSKHKYQLSRRELDRVFFAPQHQLPTAYSLYLSFSEASYSLFFSFLSSPSLVLLHLYGKTFSSLTDVFCFFVSTTKTKTHPVPSANMPRSRNDSASSVGSQVSFQLPTELSVRDPIVRRATPFPFKHERSDSREQTRMEQWPTVLASFPPLSSRK